MSDDDALIDYDIDNDIDNDGAMDVDVDVDDTDDMGDEALLDASEDDAAFYETLDAGIDKEVANYRTLEPSEISAEVDATVTRVADLFELPAPTARLLLAHCKWNETKLIERISEDETRLYKESGVPNPKESKKLKKISAGTVMECTICFNDFKFQESCRAVCGHTFCAECWGRYLEVKIRDGQVARITCAAKGCSSQLDSAAVAQLLESAGLATLLPRFHKLSVDAYVMQASNLRWCPGKGCVNAVRVEILKEKEVVCACGTRFCFGCGALPHAPCDCEMMAAWLAKCSKDGDDLKWMAQFTKECPKCKTLIHKDGGCQYMSCSHCQHKFCWMCLGAFDHKEHSCNKLAEEKDPTTERALLNKFIHFFTRYQMHQQSIELEDKLMGVADHTMKELSEKGAAWIDVQYIKQATVALMEARAMLKYTYVYGYFLPGHVNRSIFEYLQADLESAVERLSGMLEANGDKERLKVINASEYVKQRQKNLLEGLLEGEIGGLGGKDSEQNYKNSVQKYDGWVYNAGR